MFKIALALFRISKEVKRIREILEIAHKTELAKHSLYSSSSYNSIPYSEIQTSPKLKRDIYGNILELEEDLELEKELEEDNYEKAAETT